MVTKIKVAFVGAGYMTTEHIKAFASLPDVTIAGIFSRSADRAALLAAPHGAIVAASVDDLYARTQADLVVVSVPELAMAAIAGQCFLHPWQVLLEKPAGYNLPDAQRIRDAALAAGATVHVALNRRAYSSTRAALDQLSDADGKRFIKVLDQQDQIAARIHHGQPELVAQNYMFANSIHVIDYFRVFGRGSIVGVTPVVAWTPEAPGLVIAKLEFSSGDIGVYEGIWDGPGPWAVSVSTAAKRIEMRPLEQGTVQLRDTRAQIPLEVSEDDRNYKPGLRYQAEQALLAVRGQPARLAGIDDSLQSMKLVADIFGVTG
ncbi:MAG TPA: Gfo/Idh/MocA family oxidoreductase [Devosia sp.]|jgi:predicted dehydrogenase|nr:Gfo/Idh/MocA family oxidoreductase [Devosia sp.]